MFFRQSRVVAGLLYNIDDINALIDRFGFADYDWAYIYHDKDLKEDGTPKPAHYHFYGRRKSPITEQSLANFAKTCKENFFYENLRSNEHALLNYFMHIDCNNKTPYDKSEIVSNFDIDRELVTEDTINPSIIVSMLDSGLTVIDIIRKYPKLIYSIASLQRYQRELTMYNNARNYKPVEPVAVQSRLFDNLLKPVRDENCPF